MAVVNFRPGIKANSGVGVLAHIDLKKKVTKCLNTRFPLSNMLHKCESMIKFKNIKHILLIAVFLYSYKNMFFFVILIVSVCPL